MRVVSTSVAARLGIVAAFVATNFVTLAAVAEPATAVTTEGSEVLEDAGCLKDEDVNHRTNELFGRAMAAWERGDSVGAVAAMREAQGVSHCSAYLFVLGEMERQLRNDCDALGWYERYLDENPSGQKSTLARSLIAELRGRCLAPQTEAKPGVAGAPDTQLSSRSTAVTAPPRPTQTDRYWTAARIGGWSSIGASAALALGAAFYAVSAESAASDYEQLWNATVSDPNRGREWQQRRSALERRGSSASTTAWGLGAAAGALAIGGTVLLLLHPTANTDPSHDVALSVQPSGVSARYGARF